MRTATAAALGVAGRPRERGGGIVEVPVRVSTRLFGTLALSLRLPISSREGAGETVAWSRSLAFPGLLGGERLTRDTALPPRAPILARDGSVLAEGSPGGAEQRSSPLGAAAAAVIG